MDIFTEQLVSKAKTGKSAILKALIVIGAIILIIVINYFLAIFGLVQIIVFATAGLILLTYFAVIQFNVEYEYIVTNGDIDIDKITNKSTRKRILSIKARDFEEYGEFTQQRDTGNYKIIDVSGNDNKKYYALFKHSKYGNTKLIFSPNEKVLAAIKPFSRKIV